MGSGYSGASGPEGRRATWKAARRATRRKARPAWRRRAGRPGGLLQARAGWGAVPACRRPQPALRLCKRRPARSSLRRPGAGRAGPGLHRPRGRLQPGRGARRRPRGGRGAVRRVGGSAVGCRRTRRTESCSLGWRRSWRAWLEGARWLQRPWASGLAVRLTVWLDVSLARLLLHSAWARGGAAIALAIGGARSSLQRGPEPRV